WTVKGGKRGFFGIVAHFATAKGDLRDVAINLPQLLGAYTSDRIANCVAETLQKFNITAQNLIIFSLNKDAFNNDENLAEEEKYLNE
ncbi:hypothetical protein A1F97_11129, partial [Pyrenophora tritici-repentis]